MAASLLIGIYFIINNGSKGPDITNYTLATTDTGGIAHKSFIYIIIYFQNFLSLEYLMNIVAPLLIFRFEIKNFPNFILACVSLLLIFHLSYASNALFGNLLRQGFATIIFILLFKMLPKLSLLSMMLHQVIILVYPIRLFLNTKLNAKIFSPRNLVIFLIIILALPTFFYDRFIVVLQRSVQDDLVGALFVFCLLILRFLFLPIQYTCYTPLRMNVIWILEEEEFDAQLR